MALLLVVSGGKAAVFRNTSNRLLVICLYQGTSHCLNGRPVELERAHVPPIEDFCTLCHALAIILAILLRVR